MDIDDATLRGALLGFRGVKRRFTKTGEAGGITVIDDYGHHPVEIAAVLKAARQAGARDVIAVVQPHRYTRLHSLFNEFCTCMNDAGTVIVADVYPAGETPIAGMHRDALVEGLRARGHRSVVPLPSPGRLAEMVHAMAKPGRFRRLPGRRFDHAMGRRAARRAGGVAGRRRASRCRAGRRWPVRRWPVRRWPAERWTGRRWAVRRWPPRAGRRAMMAAPVSHGLLDTLPQLRGRAQADAPLAPFTWFRVGGAAEVLVRPADADDLAQFLAALPRNLPMHVLGACSNLIIRDGGLPGVTIRLARGFNAIAVEADGVIAGAAALDVTVAEHAAAAGLTGLEFLSGIPGTIGGAVAMNAGAYGGDVAGVLDWAEIVSREGDRAAHERGGPCLRLSPRRGCRRVRS